VSFHGIETWELTTKPMKITFKHSGFEFIYCKIVQKYRENSIPYIKHSTIKSMSAVWNCGRLECRWRSPDISQLFWMRFILMPNYEYFMLWWISVSSCIPLRLPPHLLLSTAPLFFHFPVSVINSWSLYNGSLLVLRISITYQPFLSFLDGGNCPSPYLCLHAPMLPWHLWLQLITS